MKPIIFAKANKTTRPVKPGVKAAMSLDETLLDISGRHEKLGNAA
jgi:hypothetical protein